VSCGAVVLQVTPTLELNDSQVIEFERIIPVELAQPPWNYTLALSKGITVRVHSFETFALALSCVRGCC